MQANWSNLNRFQLGKYAEYYAKMEFTKAGLDVYTSEIDNKGIDFLIRKDSSSFFDIQVKGIRGISYVFARKSHFQPRDNLFLMLLIFEDNKEPVALLIASLAWTREEHQALVDREYIGLKSKPEYGINLKRSNLKDFSQKFSFETVLAKLLNKPGF